MKICPYDCTVCINPECRVEGCGMLFVAVRYSTFCVMCINSEP